jgi:energy-coupling factor transporter transmembrane protein EcfT
MDIKKNLPLISVLIALTLLTFIFLGINIYSIVILILYILFFLIFVSKTLTFTFLVNVSKWFILLGIFLLSVLIFVIVNPKSSRSSKSAELSPSQCKPYYERYNQEVYDISGDGITGTMGVTINPENCETVIAYNFLITADVPRNYEIPNSGYPDYKYVSSIRETGEERSSAYGMIELQPVLKTTLPGDLYSYGIDSIEYGYEQLREGTSTNKFYGGWLSQFIFYEDAIDTLTSRTLLDMVDASDYEVVESTGENSFSYTIDEDKACAEGPIVKSIDLEYTKR